MQDKTRLAITGVVVLGATAVTVAGWGGHHFSFNWDRERNRPESTRTLPNLQNFQGVELAGPDNVVITRGASFSVSAEGDDDALDRLNIFVKDGVLHVTRRDGLGSNLVDDGAAIHVTLPALANVSISGSGDMIVDKLDGQQVKAAISGTGDLMIAELVAKEADISLTGTGDLGVNGRTRIARLSTTGTGDLDASNLATEQASLKLTGTGDIAARASQNADISVLGSGDAQVTGTTLCQISKTGSGDAQCTS